MKSIRFNVSMVQLLDLQLMNIQLSEIILNQTRTPNLQELFLQNVPEDCRIEILLPTLKKFQMFYYQGYRGAIRKFQVFEATLFLVISLKLSLGNVSTNK